LFVFANLPWDFVYLWVTQSRKVRAWIPIIPRTVKVTYARCRMIHQSFLWHS
jgi:hypothetical protein